MFEVYIEACIATTMGSQTVFRTLFLRRRDKAPADIEKRAIFRDERGLPSNYHTKDPSPTLTDN